MSGPSLCMLVRLMVAQVQECVFERLTLTTKDTHFSSQLRLAQEAARVSYPPVSTGGGCEGKIKQNKRSRI